MSTVGRRGLPEPCLMLVTDRSLTGGVDGLARAVAAAVAGGVNAIQVREKDLSSEALLDLCRTLFEVAQGRAVMLVNDRPAVALAAGAFGVHLGEQALPVRAARRAVRDRLLVGRSVHGVDAAVQAARDGADYLVLGTIFASRSHPGGETGGVERLREVTAVVDLPVVAIGGITVDRVPAVVDAGAAGVAVISAILGEADPRAAAARLRDALRQAWAARSMIAASAGEVR